MTPQQCLTATPAELAPIVEQLMPTWKRDGDADMPGWFDCVDDDGFKTIHAPCEDIADAFRLQERVAELGLLDDMIRWHWTASGEPSDENFPRYCMLASPLCRTRAACAAYLESKEPARASNL